MKDAANRFLRSTPVYLQLYNVEHRQHHEIAKETLFCGRHYIPLLE